MTTCDEIESDKPAQPGLIRLVMFFVMQGAAVILVGFAAFKNHCSFFPMSSTVLEEHRDALTGYETSKGTIRFSADDPLPVALVKKLVKARIAENEARRTS